MNPRAAACVIGMSIAAVVACVSIQWFTGDWYPAWVDDVMQMEPAVNWSLGRGFVTFAQMSQSGRVVYATNNALYPFLLAPWIALCGVDCVCVRLFNQLLCLAALVLASVGCRRMGILTTVAGTCAAVAIALFLESVSFIYRSGRGDTATMMACALIVFAWSWNRTGHAHPFWLFASAICVVPSGIHAIPYVGVLIVLAYLFDPLFRWSAAALVVSGSLSGMVALLGYYAAKGVCAVFLQSTFASGVNILGTLAQCLVIGDTKAVMRLAEILQKLAPVQVLGACIRDKSSWFLMLGLAATAVSGTRDPVAKAVASKGLLASLVIPVTMLLAGRYPTYYTWMATIPVAIAFVGSSERVLAHQPSTVLGRSLIAFALASMLQGFPQRVATDLQSFGPAGRADIAAICREHLRAGDVVYGARAIYFPVKQRNLDYIAISYSGGRGYPKMSDAERESVTLIIVPESELDEALQRVGGEWSEVGRHPVHIDMSSARVRPQTFLAFRRRGRS